VGAKGLHPITCFFTFVKSSVHRRTKHYQIRHYTPIAIEAKQLIPPAKTKGGDHFNNEALIFLKRTDIFSNSPFVFNSPWKSKFIDDFIY
jgi:hypothetical protein